jgi:hypothetical protein
VGTGRERGGTVGCHKNLLQRVIFGIAKCRVAVHKDQAIMAILPKDRLYGPEQCSGPFFLGLRD